MNPSYNLFHSQAHDNIQLYTVLRFSCLCNHATALTHNTYEPASAFLAANVSKSFVYTMNDINDKAIQPILDVAKNQGVKLTFEKIKDQIDPTELLYINTPAEGNFRAMELMKYCDKVSKYILLPNTVEFAHTASPNIRIADDVKPLGIVFGINHFLQINDDWFILEHNDVNPGMTVLVNKKNVQ
jgi:hypothetical protein